MWSRIIDVAAMIEYVQYKNAIRDAPSVVQGILTENEGNQTDSLAKKEMINAEQAVPSLLNGVESTRSGNSGSSGSSGSSFGSGVFSKFSQYLPDSLRSGSGNNTAQSITDKLKSVTGDPSVEDLLYKRLGVAPNAGINEWSLIVGERYYDVMMEAFGLKAPPGQETTWNKSDREKALDYFKASGEDRASESEASDMSLGMSMSKCVADMQQSGNLKNEQEGDSNYQIQCVGGIACEALMFTNTLALSALKVALTTWARTVADFPFLWTLEDCR